MIFLIEESLLYLRVKIFCCSITGMVIRNYWNFFFGLPTLHPQLPMKRQNDATCRPSRKLDKNWIFCRSKVSNYFASLEFFSEDFWKSTGWIFSNYSDLLNGLGFTQKKVEKTQPPGQVENLTKIEYSVELRKLLRVT